MMHDTDPRRVALLLAFLAGLCAIGMAMTGCATLGASDFARRVCASGELATGLTAVDAAVAALDEVALDLELAGKPVPAWLPQTVAALRKDRAAIAAGCRTVAP